MPGGEDFEAALGRYWKLSWRAASTPTLDKLREAEWRNMRNGDGSAWLGLTEDYLALGYTLEGARWMVEQAATKKSLPPPEWPPTLAEDFEQLFPAAAIAITDDSVLVADAVLFYGDGPAFETDFNNSKHVRRLEHLIGDPYEAEKPTTSTAIRQWAGPAKNEDERNRRNRWDLAQLIEHKIANGTITPVNETRNRHRELVPLGCLITLTDFVAAAREHGKGCNRFKAWLAQHEQELSGPVAEVDTAPDRGNPVAGDENSQCHIATSKRCIA